MRQWVSVCIVFASLCALGSRAWSEEAVPASTPAPAPTSPPVAETPAAAAAQAHVPELSGDWCGNWQSCTNGHNGPMRASFCRMTDGNYQVTFVGKFCLLIPFRYTTTMTVTGQKDGVVYLAGSQNLGPLFGTFTYSAWANDCQFVSSYCSRKDQGQFTLTR